MKLKVYLILLVLALLGLSISAAASELTESTATYEKPAQRLTEDDKLALLDCSYSVLDSSSNLSHGAKETVLSDISREFDYDRLFVTIYSKGTLRACQSSSKRGVDNRIAVNVADATAKCLKDDRYGGVLVSDEVLDAELVFTFLFNRKLLKNMSMRQLEKEIELGVNAIEVENGKKRAFYVESVPVKGNLNLRQTLEKLCVKAGLKKTSYKSNKTNVYKYDTLTFKGNRAGEITDLYRYNVLVDVDDITQEGLYSSIASAQKWFSNNTNPKTGLVEYEYYPVSDRYSEGNNHVRRLGTAWSMARVQNFLEDDILDPEIRDTLDYYLNHKHEYKGYGFIAVDGSAPLAYNAFLILALLNVNDYPNREAIVRELAEGVLAVQREDGSYYTDLLLRKNTQADYYPGEALLALMKAYDHTRDPRYLDSAERAFTYYRAYWRENKNTAFVPWHTQAYYMLYGATNDREIADFIFEMNDWLIDNYQTMESSYPDEIGGMPKGDPGCSTSSYLEGLNDAYSLAKEVGDEERAARYEESLRYGTRFILQTQYNPRNTFFTKNPDRAMGGFRRSLTRNTIRNDHVQHAVMALMKVYNNRIFRYSMSKDRINGWQAETESCMAYEPRPGFKEDLVNQFGRYLSSDRIMSTVYAPAWMPEPPLPCTPGML